MGIHLEEDQTMMIVELENTNAKAKELVGAKAASLAEILSLGIPTTNGFCITAEAYTQHLQQLLVTKSCPDLPEISNAHYELTKGELAKLRHCIQDFEISKILEQKIDEALKKLESSVENLPLRVAVRSSATTEDLPNASFAGQYDTYLNVSGKSEIIDRIKRCWASFWTERAYYYRNKKGFEHWQGKMAVIVAEIIDSEAAGTMFTMNPITKNMQEILIEAAWGLGELVVKGQVTPDSYFVDTSGKQPVINRRLIKNKRKMLISNLSVHSGIQEIQVPKERIAQQVLDDRIILELANYGSLLYRHYQRPLDIEWAFYKGKLTILQSRPITA